MSEETSPAPYDLHLHTWWSYDARSEIETYFTTADRLGVRCIAITEHHNIDSLASVLKKGQNFPNVRAIPAAELSVTTSKGAIDLLCYNLPVNPSGTPLEAVFKRYHEYQREAGAAVSKGLCQLGYDYPDPVRLEVLRTYRPEAAIDFQGVTHVNNNVQRNFFLERGFIHSADEYRPLMKQVSSTVTIPPYPPVRDVVDAVHAVGGLVVIAHPAGYFQRTDTDRMDALRDECALDGIECAHPLVDPELTPFYREYCVKHNLLSTGGSDCHTHEDIQTKFARHGGDPRWLDEFLERLA